MNASVCECLPSKIKMLNEINGILGTHQNKQVRGLQRLQFKN
jgi:hypothetical protein